MDTLIVGIIVFLGIHLIPTFPKARAKMVKAMGPGKYRATYSLIALFGFVLIIWGFAQARPAPVVWTPPEWSRHVAMLLMLPVFVLLVSGRLPGKISALARHPMLVAIKLWALAHLLVNGDVASMTLFGSFLAFAVYDRISMKRRDAPQAAAAAFGRNDILALLVGLGIYVFMILWAHPFLFGVPVIPR
ncbi:MAG: NnrU family protein [Parvularculaceae bacterium]